MTYLRTSPAVIMEQLRKVIQEYRNEKRESIFSSLSADSLTSDERTQWRVVRKELASNGLTLEVLDKHRELVIDCLSDVLGSVATQYRDTTATEEGKGKERVADLPPLINQDLTVNPFTNSAFDVSSERRKGADKDIGIEADIIIQFEARESEPASLESHFLIYSYHIDRLRRQLQPFQTLVTLRDVHNRHNALSSREIFAGFSQGPVKTHAKVYRHLEKLIK